MPLPGQRSHCLGGGVERLAARNEGLEISVGLVEVLIEQGHPFAVARVEIEKIGQMACAVRQVLAVVELAPSDELVELRATRTQFYAFVFGRWLSERIISLQKCVQPRHTGPPC